MGGGDEMKEIIAKVCFFPTLWLVTRIFLHILFGIFGINYEKGKIDMLLWLSFSIAAGIMVLI